MNEIYKIILLGLLSLCVTTGWAQEPVVYRPEQMQADLRRFEIALTKIHPGTYTHQNPEEFEQTISDLMLKTSKPLRATEFYKVVLKLIASIHDGHTQAYAFGKLGKLINNQRRIPFQVYIRNQRIFIVKDMSTQAIPEGSEILAIDDHLSNEILYEVLKHYSSDGKSHNGMLHWLGGPYKPFYRLYPEIYGEKQSHNLVYRDYQSKKIKTIEIDTITRDAYEAAESKKYPSKNTTEEAFSFEVKGKKEKYAFLKINRLIKDGFDDPENIYPDFYRKSFKEISQENIQNLIIDLRDNGGGKASNAAYLLQYFIDTPIKPAKEIFTLGNDADFLEITGKALHLDDAFGLTPKKNGSFKVTKSGVLRDLMVYNPVEKYRYTGKLIVLINGGTTSAAGIAAGLLREYTNAVFVGEETYGYAGISNGIRQISVKGEHTETAIYLPLLHAEYAVNSYTQKRSIVPDYQVSSSVQDILNDNDAILEFTSQKLLPTTYEP